MYCTFRLATFRTDSRGFSHFAADLLQHINKINKQTNKQTVWRQIETNKFQNSCSSSITSIRRFWRQWSVTMVQPFAGEH